MSNIYQMYNLSPPPKRENYFNDYFIKYLNTKDSSYFSAFLHYYEPVLNNKAKRFIKIYNIENDRIADLKQIFVSLLFEEIQNYTTEEKLPVLQLIKYKLLDSWFDYVRTNCSYINVGGKEQYRKLRNVSKLYFDNKDNMEYDKLVNLISSQLGLSKSYVVQMIQTAIAFKYPDRLDDFDDTNRTIPKQQISDKSVSNIEDDFLKKETTAQLLTEINRLSPLDKRLLELITGKFFDTGETFKPKTYNETSLLLGLTESAVEKRRKRIINKLRKIMK